MRMYVGGYNRRYDYSYGAKYVGIPAGVTNTSFSVTIYDDDRIESNETFRLTISPESLPHYVHYGSINSTTVTIVDEHSEQSIHTDIRTKCCIYITYVAL